MWCLIVSTPDLCPLSFFESLDRIKRDYVLNWATISSDIFNGPLQLHYCTSSEGSGGAYRFGLESACVCAFTLSNMNISETSRPIEIKFHLEHHWGGGNSAERFGPNRIRILVSMATDSSDRVTMGKIL